MPAVAKTTTMNKNSKTCLKGGHPIAGEGVRGWMERVHIEIARASTRSEITNTNNDRKWYEKSEENIENLLATPAIMNKKLSSLFLSHSRLCISHWSELRGQLRRQPCPTVTPQCIQRSRAAMPFPRGGGRLTWTYFFSGSPSASPGRTCCCAPSTVFSACLATRFRHDAF